MGSLIVITGAVGALLGAGLVAALGARRTDAALRRLRTTVERITRGDFSHPADISGRSELTRLNASLTEMSAHLQSTLAELHKRQSDQDALLASIADAVISVDRRARVVLLNPAAERIFGQALAAVQGRALATVVRQYELNESVYASIAGGTEATLEIRTHGQTFEARIAPIRVRGDVAGAIVVMRDITQLRRLEGMRRDFVANVAHELRSPLTAIKGFLESLLDGALEEPELAQRFVGIAKAETDRLVQLVQDLLELSRLESNAQIAPEPTPLSPEFERAVDLLAERADEKRIELRTELADAALAARVDPRLLHQVLVNLLDNAVKYTPAGGRVTLAGDRDGDQVRIRVQDTGIGIAEAHLERIFERFYRVDKGRSRDEGGTGLGLAIVKHIAERHGGRVRAESRLGKGSTFSVWLPTA